MSPSSRRRLLGALHAAAALVVLAAVVAHVDRPLAPALTRVPSGAELFDSAFLARVRAYRTPRELVRLALLALTVAVPAWWALTGSGRRATARVRAWAGPGHPLRGAALLAVVIVVSLDVLSLPLVFWAGFVQDGAYGFRTQGLGGWARDWLVVRAPGWLGVALALPLLVAAVRRLPRAWPPLIGLAAGVLAAGLTLVAPLLLEPLWLHTTPLPPGEDRDAVEEVIARSGEPVDRILVGDASRRSTKANAYVSGLGGTRRVVLFDTLLDQAAPREVGIVVAHELAHDRHADIGRGVLLGAGGSVLAAYAIALLLGRAARDGRIPAPGDPSAVPLAALGLAVLMVLSLPVQSLLSRRAEAAADWTALELTADPDGFIAMQRTLADSHLADPSPPEWVRLLWYTHPTVAERIGLARQWAGR